MRTWQKLGLTTAISALITLNLLIKEIDKPVDLNFETKPSTYVLQRYVDFVRIHPPRVAVGTTVTDILGLATGVAYIVGKIKDYRARNQGNQ